MLVYDAVQDLVDLINTDWLIVNTDNVKPNIDKITNVPFDLQFGDNKGFILLYSINESEDMPGLGLTSSADIKETIKIDVRFGGQSDWPVVDIETRFNLYKAELKRILYSNRLNPSVNYCILDLDNKSIQNLSNRSKKLFREIREVSMDANNRDLTI